MIDKIIRSNKFKTDYKKALKRGCSESAFKEVLSLLINQRTLPKKYKDHALVNSKHYHNVRECHIQPDWLLVYRIDHDSLILELIRTGSHSDLFL